jgi:hypothetical protein
MAQTERTADPVPLIPAPGGPIDPSAVQGAVRDWVAHPVFTELVASFGGPGVQSDLPCYLQALEHFSETWDYRGGKERDLAQAGQLLEERQAQILRAARILGLREGFARPRAQRYDHCLILGGMIRACMTRSAWAAELARTGVHLGDVTALGGFRSISRHESALARSAGLGDVEDEFHAMTAGMRRSFRVDDDPVADGRYDTANPNRSWAVHRFAAAGTPLAVVAAPSSQPEARRANTADSYAWWAENIADLRPDHRILLVTNSIYVPFQHADAVRILAAVYGSAVETVGVPQNWRAGMPQQRFTAANYLQEMRSAIRSMRNLVDFVRQI